MMSLRRKKAEMSEPQYEGGGWGNSLLDGMSPSMQARIAQADYEYDKQAKVEQREAERHRGRMWEQATRASIQAALDRGEAVDLPQALRDGGVGRTPQEAVEYCSRMMDIEDERLAAKVQREFQQFQQGYYHDTTAPTPAEKLEAGARAAEAERAAAHARSKRAEVRKRRKESDELDSRIVRFSRAAIRNVRATEGW
jgi:hypothetical protein